MKHLGHLGISWDEGWWTLVNDVMVRAFPQVLREDSLHRNHWSYLVSPSCHLHQCHLDSKSVHVAARRRVHGMLVVLSCFIMFSQHFGTCNCYCLLYFYFEDSVAFTLWSILRLLQKMASSPVAPVRCWSFGNLPSLHRTRHFLNRKKPTIYLYNRGKTRTI